MHENYRMDWSISLYHRLFIGKHQKDPSGSTELSAPEYFGRDMFDRKFIASVRLSKCFYKRCLGRDWSLCDLL
jgi:hypothetical protein